MDAIKVTKVEGVQCRKAGQTVPGVLHLTAHHLIFEHHDKVKEEMWIPYPLISLVTRMPLTLEGDSPITIHSRNFRSFTLSFKKDIEAIDVFDSIRGLTVTSTVSQLYAFFYTPSTPYDARGGWTLYSPREEFTRMGVGSRTKAWRFTDINKDYSFCATYPARLVIPTRISDTTLQYASKYRSKCRIPALTYLHWANYGTITRSSQPMVGLTNNRSIQDEKLIEAIFQSHHAPESRSSAGPVYGATATNLIIDARPTTNAMANVAKGAGTENMDYYKEGKKAYLGIDNIHVMRDSLNKVVEVLREADAFFYSVGNDGSDSERLSSANSAFLDRQALRRSGWLRHLSAILDGTLLIVRNVHVNSSHVLIHCSDGWDRTAQLSSLAQLCLDPFYRTLKGFQILIEKDWLSFGHRFLDRCGHLSSEKFFLSATDIPSGGGGAEAAQALLASVQNRLVGQGHLKETSPVFHQFLECFNSRYLEQIHYHLYSCQFGTFLFNCEGNRKKGDNALPPCERTISVWDFLNSSPEVEKNTNLSYDSALDNPSRRDHEANMGVLFPNPKDVRFWNELYGRTDEEMNGKMIAVEAQGVDIIGPVEGAEDDPISSNVQASSLFNNAVSSPHSSSTPISRSLSSALTLSTSKALADDPPAKRRMQKLSSARTLSSSMPELAQQRPSPSRQDSFRPFPASSSFTLRPTSPFGVDSSNGSLHESVLPRQRLGLKQAEVFPGGVKSMWGKLSSNASAAFTAVQGAYGMTIVQGRDGERGVEGELQSRDRPPDEADWTSAVPPSQIRDSTFVPTWTSDLTVPSDRWRTEGSKTRLSTLTLENPWGIQKRMSERPSSKKAEDVFATSSVWADDAQRSPSSLPSDPTVLSAIPSPVPLHVPPDEGKSISPSPTTCTSPAPSHKAFDPLGVL
ncbi:phosphatases II [Phellopilus nigrolimitatus]|nr:phosphatases II [Phellopilus nigrolimitatus]